LSLLGITPSNDPNPSFAEHDFAFPGSNNEAAGNSFDPRAHGILQLILEIRLSLLRELRKLGIIILILVVQLILVGMLVLGRLLLFK
jgi:hypothetical protein